MKNNDAANYETPLGAFRTWEEAAAACERADLEPTLVIRYVPTGVIG